MQNSSAVKETGYPSVNKQGQIHRLHICLPVTEPGTFSLFHVLYQTLCCKDRQTQILGPKISKPTEVENSEQIIKMNCDKGMHKSREDKVETNEEGIKRLDVGRTELTRSIKKQTLVQMCHRKSDLEMPKLMGTLNSVPVGLNPP